MQLFGPTFVGHLPSLPAGDPAQFFVTVDDLPVLGAAYGWGLSEVTEPTDVEYIELAFRLGLPFSNVELLFCPAALPGEDYMVIDGVIIQRKLALASLASAARMKMRDLLPRGQAFAVDKLGTLGRAFIRIGTEA